MIYLIKAYGEDGPLGYSDNLDRRLGAYQTHTPDYVLLDVREGDLDTETGLHNYFKNYRYNNEWFRYDKFIIDNFKTAELLPELMVPAKINVKRKKKVINDVLMELNLKKEDYKLLELVLSRLLRSMSLRTDQDIDPVKTRLREVYLGFSNSVLKFFNKFLHIRSTREKMKYLCTTDIPLNDRELEQIFREIPDFYRNVYIGLGPDRCRALGFNHTLLKKDLNVKFFSTDLIKESVLSQFNEGQSLSTAEIKSTLKDIYSSLGYEKTAKATDLEKYFEIKKIKLKDQSGSWVNGFELLKRKV